MEISYHYEHFSVTGLTVYISCPKDFFVGNLSELQYLYHNRLNFILLACMHYTRSKSFQAALMQPVTWYKFHPFFSFQERGIFICVAIVYS